MFLALNLAAALLLMPSDPLAPARSGQVLCFEPDPAARTCLGQARYRWMPDDTVASDLIVRVSRFPITVHSTATVHMRGLSECSAVGNASAQITAIYEEGQPLQGSDFDEARDLLGGAIDIGIGPGRELCLTHEVQADNTLRLVAYVDGRRRADLDSAARWVDPTDGWRLAP